MRWDYLQSAESLRGQLLADSRRKKRRGSQTITGMQVQRHLGVYGHLVLGSSGRMKCTEQRMTK